MFRSRMSQPGSPRAARASDRIAQHDAVVVVSDSESDDDDDVDVDLLSDDNSGAHDGGSARRALPALNTVELQSLLADLEPEESITLLEWAKAANLEV